MGGFLAAWIGWNAPVAHALVLGGLLTLAGIANNLMLPPPGWFWIPSLVHAMPASIPALGSAGVKWVSGYPGNTARGLPYITGLLILNDPETGMPKAVMDATWITAMRTGAATARRRR